MDTKRYVPSGNIQAENLSLPDRGTSVGFQSTSHGVEFALDATQRLGSVERGDDCGDCLSDARPQPAKIESAGNRSSDQYTGVISVIHD